MIELTNFDQLSCRNLEKLKVANRTWNLSLRSIVKHSSRKQTAGVYNKGHLSAKQPKIHLTKPVDFNDRLCANLLEPMCRENPRRWKRDLHRAKYLSWRTSDPKSPWTKKRLPPFCQITCIKCTKPCQQLQLLRGITVFHLSTGNSNFSNNVMLLSCRNFLTCWKWWRGKSVRPEIKYTPS